MNTNFDSRRLPADLADVALIDAATFAGVGGMSVSWLLGEVRAGRAPAPVIRQPRFSRWKLTDVRDFWIARAEASADNTQAAESVAARAKKASAAARAKRGLAAAICEPGAKKVNAQ